MYDKNTFQNNETTEATVTRNLHRCTSRATNKQAVRLKSALELCFLGPCMITSMYTWNGLLTGMTLEDVARKCKRDLVPAWKVAACCFGPAGLINYAFVPLR